MRARSSNIPLAWDFPSSRDVLLKSGEWYQPKRSGCLMPSEFDLRILLTLMSSPYVMSKGVRETGVTQRNSSQRLLRNKGRLERKSIPAVMRVFLTQGELKCKN